MVGWWDGGADGLAGWRAGGLAARAEKDGLTNLGM